MKLKNDFYFWSSWFLLVCLILLVFHMYQIQFGFQEIIDLKTILTVLGTVFGAYFGAKTAGKFAIESVEKQIKYQKDQDELKEKKVYEKVVQEYSAHCEGLHSYLLSFILTFEKTQFSSPNEKIYVLDDAEKFINPKVQRLKEINTSAIYGTTYFKIELLNIGANNLLGNIQDMLKHLESNEVELYLTERTFFIENLAKLEGYIFDARRSLK